MTSAELARLEAFSTKNALISASVYYGMGGPAHLFASPRTLTELLTVVEHARAQSLPFAIIGSGSNSVCSDAPFDGVLISLAGLRRWHWLTPSKLHVEAGVTNTEIAEACLEAGVGGGHWMYRMPGLLGASVRMNARCYGGEMSQVVESVTTLTTDGSLLTRTGAEVFQGYKSTVLMRSPEIVVSAVLAFGGQEERPGLLARMLACENDRHGKHHFDHPSCGSTFKNNYDVGKPSGRVFDELGLKGTRVGACEVSAFHANFVWNLGGARAEDMLSLAALMREKALAAGADLELEVQPVGVFDAVLYERCAMDRLGPAVDAKRVHGASGAPQKWVGLAWHPDMEEIAATGAPLNSSQARAHFPRTLLQVLPEEYFRTPGNNLAAEAGVAIKLTQLTSLAQAKASPSEPFLRFETRVAQEGLATVFPLSPDAIAGSFVDELWRFSVSELFLSHPAWQSAGVHTPAEAKARGVVFPYREFEITPEGHWVALAFEGVRARTSASAVPTASIWPGVVPDVTSEGGMHRFALNIPFEALAPVLEGNRLLVQGALSLGANRYFLAPHWFEAEPDVLAPLLSAPAPVETACFGWQPNVTPDFHQPWRGFPVTLA